MASKWNYWPKYLLALIFVILGTNSDDDPFAQQPRIAIKDGHLIIQAALGRDIKLLSTGKVMVNNIDMAEPGERHEISFRNALRHILKEMNIIQNLDVNNLMVQVSRLEDNVTDIVQRLDQFAGADQSRITNRGIRRYFSKVKKLEDKVNRLTELLSTDECSSNPCRNGGTCRDSYNGYVCVCPNNWEGPHCESDVNECYLYSGTAFGCQNGATCENLPGTYRCNCPTNWFGIHCTEQHDDCSIASHQELCGHGTCINEKRDVIRPDQPKYRCICEPGWTNARNTPACTQDVNECEGAERKCSSNPYVECINLPGTFHCASCPAGYTGNGLQCQDINECEQQNGGCSTNPLVECINTPGSRRCGPCPTGFIGNGQQCVFSSVCSFNNGGCHPLATCINNPAITMTYRECRCPPGYVGSGDGPTGCIQGEGISCANDPCQHGTCQMIGQTYHCVCQSGYYGTHCEIQEDPCLSAPCQNGGSCLRRSGTFTCVCPSEYGGSTCAEERRQCGGRMFGSNGTIHYPEPSHSQNYEHLQDCGWIITVASGMVVNVTFDHFHLEGGYNCEYDFLQLNDGPSAMARPIGRFCSDQLHGETFTSTHNQVYLWFHSDRSISRTGFTINWLEVEPVCGGERNISDYGSVNSPGYPGLYPINRTCSWLIQVPYGKRIQFSFATLRLEHHENCSYDYLKIFDGADESDPLLGTFCSTETPPPLVTSGHTATILFHSDYSEHDVGFHIVYSAIAGVQGCGDVMTAPQGTITSPGFYQGNNYQPNLLCEWLIRIHPDNKIQISFTEFNLEPQKNCSYDSLEIYDGTSENAGLLGRYCGANIPPDLLSTSNQVYIRFKTDVSLSFSGFKLEYKTICGGFYTELNGVLTSPYYPDPYTANTLCLYQIKLPMGYLVNLTIHNIEIEPHNECKYDFLEVRDGESETSRQVALLCGHSAPESIVSTYNFLWLKFETDGSVQNKGFYAQYEAIEIACGGIMTENNSQILSPDDTGFYPNSVTCVWLIRAPEGHFIRLSFSNFHLEAAQNCDYDYVLLEDTDGVPIGKYCGSTAPPIITTMDNSLIMKFVSDTSVAMLGFAAQYIFLDASEACGGTFYHDSGIIRSPGYPNHYPHSANCVWVLQASNSRQILLNVTNFALEHHGDCNFDFLEIRNGGYDSSPLIGKYCGNEVLPIIRSHSNALWIRFKSDVSMSAPGFEIYFDSTSVGCGGTLTTTRGTIVSPNYPQPYPRNADCQWLIRVSEGSRISLAVVDIHIEETLNCYDDYLEVFDGDSENSKSIARMCNNQQIPANLVSSDNTMLLRFRSDFSQEAGGFHVVYQADCRNILTKRSGVIESPNFPNPYPHNHNCSWIIQAPAGSNITITFSHLFIERAENCSYDYVEVRENRSIDNRIEEVQLGKFCGDMPIHPNTIHTQTNYAVVMLITDRSKSGRGFRLEYTINGCGGDIFSRPFGTIMSPGYPNGYPDSTECYWHIWYPVGSKVEFTIENFDLEASVDCVFDFLKVYGGEDESSPLLLNTCHTLTNKTITSHGNHLYVHFRSDHAIATKGFRASFMKLTNGCGGRYSADESTIMSPKYPEPYDVFDNCVWQIEVNPSNLVVLEFVDVFRMPQAANCSQGYVAIYDGINTSAPLLSKRCGGKPEGENWQVSSTGHQVLVKLVSDGVHVDKGFKIHYKQGCGTRLLADRNGEIQSPNYPDFSLHSINCSWIIYASELDQKVSLTVTNLIAPEFANCSYNAMVVYDGDMADSPKIGEYCGHSIPPTIVSRGSMLHIFMKGRGILRATYGLLSEHCGGSFTAPSGSFASPEYPMNYAMDMECVWIIEASAGNKVHLTFHSNYDLFSKRESDIRTVPAISRVPAVQASGELDYKTAAGGGPVIQLPGGLNCWYTSFNLEESDYCNRDYVEIHDSDPSGTLIGKYCGRNIPSNVTSARTLWIKFRSDDIQSTASGFLAHYELIHGTVINGTSGYIASPGYPQKYHQKDDYEWTVIAPDEMFISVQFLEISLLNYQGSCRSYVEIFDGFDKNARSLGQFCGYQVTEPIVSTTNIITIVFHSNNYDPSAFHLHWSAATDFGVTTITDPETSCLETLDLIEIKEKNFTSPGYSENEQTSKYLPNYKCSYLFRTINTHHVQLKFLQFILEGSSPTCQFDRLEIFHAPNPNVDEWVLNSTLCGNIPEFTLASPNNVLKVTMITDVGVELAGFKAVATSECGGQIFGSRGVIHSTSIHPHLQGLDRWTSFSCEWIIIVKKRRTVQVTFENFDVQSDSTCSNTYILISNGGSSNSPRLGSGKYCNSRAPSNLPESSSNKVTIKVVYKIGTGNVPVFDIHYSEVSMNCGGHIYLNHGIQLVEISSPNYPSPPQHDILCDWVIMSDAGTRMRIDFEDGFHVGENYRSCYGSDGELEYVQINDGGTENANIMWRYCTDQPPSSELTTGNSLFVRYLTSLENPSPGFKATISVATCGGTISAMFKFIESPNYPENYGSATDCEWFLKMKYGFHIILQVTDFETPHSDNCSLTDYLEIRTMSPEGEIGEVVRIICGKPKTLPIRIDVPGSFAYVKFSSNTAGTGKGFSMVMNANQDEGCGGMLQDPSGVITSPRYPNALAARRDCWWKIVAPVGRKVKVTFNAMNLPRDENINACSSYVAVANITFFTSRQLPKIRYCGNTLPDEIDSISSSLYIEFTTSGLNAGEGFSLSYSTEEEAACGGVLPVPSGILQSPTIVPAPDSTVECRWSVNTGENKTLSVHFDIFDIPGSKANYCRDGSLLLTADSRYRFYGGFCGNYSNGLSLTSPYPTTNFRMIASLKTFFRGFHGTYNTTDCGGVFDGSNMVITSPNYPNNYPPNTNCHWLLTVPYGEIIKLTIEDMNLEEDCTRDYVLIKNGLSVESPSIGKFCGRQNPLPVISSTSVLTVIFHSDAFGTASGFKLTTSEVQRGCGGLSHMLQGNFSSPNYPSRYDNNVECVWTIEYNAGYLVSMEFTGRFDIERDATCSKDYLQFEDLENDGTWSLRGRKCGSAASSPFVSKSNKVKITFHSNEAVRADGFDLKYRAVCGGNFTNQRGDIISPNYPQPYGNSLSCKYTIGKRGDYIQLSFNDFSVEGHETCRYDYMEIFQLDETDENRQGIYCGDEIPAERSLQGPVTLKFVTDRYYTSHGFSLQYEVTNCGGIFTEPSGVIKSPTSLSRYAEATDCTWTIVAQDHKVIAIRFLHFDLASSYSCWRSYLSIHDGNETGPLFGKLCSREAPMFKSSGNQLTLKFHHERHVVSKGFALFYQATYGPAQGCGGLLNATSGEITSLDIDGDGHYEPDLDCAWIILFYVPDRVLKFNFSNFDLEGPTNGNCTADYVELKDDGPEGPSLGRYCGSTFPSPIISSSRRIFLHFHSNGVVNKAGFKVKFDNIPSPCGAFKRLSTTTEQTLTTPNYPNPYPVNLRCEWRIATNFTSSLYRRGSNIELSITDFDVPCNGDYLEIRSARYRYYKRVGACGSSIPPIMSLRGGVIIYFRSDSVNDGARGFSLTYRNAVCSRNYSGDNGMISSTGYPGFVKSETGCRINITAPPGKTVSLYFMHFDIYYKNCSHNFVKIYDGNNDTAARLLCDDFPNPVFSNGRTLLLEVHILSLARYLMTYTTTDAGRGCGGNVEGQYGVISSPFYPNPYNVTGECIWHIRAPGYHSLKFNFRSFALNSTSGCNSNYLEVYEGGTDDISTRIARYCGNDEPAVRETVSNDAVLKLVTDRTNNLSGFLVFFDSSSFISNALGGVIQRLPES